MNIKANNALDEKAKLTPYAIVYANFHIPKQTLPTSPEEEDILHTKFHVFSIDFTLKSSIVVAMLVDTVP